MSEAEKGQPTRSREEQFEDEIELMDYLRVIWKWKWLIIAGTLVCAVAAGVVNFSMPKVYREYEAQVGLKKVKWLTVRLKDRPCNSCSGIIYYVVSGHFSGIL